MAETENEALSLSNSLGEESKTAADYAVTITATAHNKSSKNLTVVQFQFQDPSPPGDPVVKVVDLGMMTPGQTRTGTTTLPKGFTVVVNTVYAQGDPTPHVQTGLANYAKSVEVTITD